jgi:hypothetical protein
MPELAQPRGEWEHIFEPWFTKDASAGSDSVAERSATSIFSEASQPLAVSRRDYVHRQSPFGRSLEQRASRVSTEVDRLLAYVERRHRAIEASDTTQMPRDLRDAEMPRLAAPAMPLITPAPIAHADRAAKARPGPRPPSSGSFRVLVTLAAIAAVAVYVFYVERAAASAMSRATAAELTAAETRRRAEEAIGASADQAQRSIAEALTHAARAERMIDVIAAPDARRIELSGRAPAPGAVGQALYSRSRGVIVSATNVPRPEEGRVYQVWATTSTGSVSLGLATPDAHGRLAVAYDLPPGLAGAIRGFIMTQEPPGGGSSPGAVTVLGNR